MQNRKIGISSVYLWLFSIAILIFSMSPFGYAQQRNKMKGLDTLFKKLSVEELIKIRKYYESKVQKLRTEEESYRSQGMEWSESFLKEKGQKIKNRDNMYIRLAEFYIEDADEAYIKAVDEYDKKYSEYEKQLELFDQGKLETEPQPPEFPKHDYSKAIELYDKILTEYPASEYADDALYSKAWLLEQMDKGEESRQVYRELIDKYPDSRFAPESYMRLAEYYFAPREDKTDEEQQIVELRKAIQLYKNVLKYKDSKRYDEALYKLGWSYYKLAARDPKYYNDAITYFILAADDITRAEKYDPKGEISNANVKDEAVEYIGICFTDEAYTKNGVDKARRMLERIGDRPYGPQVMKAIGTTFQKIDENEKAVYAYRSLLEMYPDYEEAPLIQKNIVDALFSLGRDQEAYAARQELYEKYNPKSDWYQNLAQSDKADKVKYLKQAYKLSEEALRTNLLLDLQAGEDLEASGKPAREMYQKVADECKIYLDYFPADSNAYDVNWSYAYLLDAKLGEFEKAFDEYIRVSNDYLEESHRHDAALNAVAVADTLVKIRFGATQDTLKKINLAEIAKMSPQALTKEETRLIEAYDNYIKLFPDGEYTPNFLAAAGGIYYNHYKFAEAKIYFQTLVKRFPGAEQKSLAMRSIMDSYFALGKFKDSEIVAKNILNEPGVSEEQKKFAAKRMGQAIFKNAEYLEEQGDYFAAANEFYRVFTDAPTDPKIIEPALLRSGLNYQKAKDWVRAIAVYDTLATRYPKSKFALPALQNMAKDYEELEQYVDAGRIYERIFEEFRNSDNADAALYNASFYYKKGKAWEDAIRVNKKYIQEFPDQSYSTDLYFDNASLYLKLGNLAEANKIYQEFAQKFPDDPRTVRAFYERGKYYMENGQFELAKAEFNKAIARSEQFRRQGKDPNAFIAAEAAFKLAEILHKEYTSIQLTQPESNIKANLAKLRKLMKDLNTAYSKVLAFGSPKSFEATYDIARTYEEFANIFVNQQINPNLSEAKKFVQRKKINEQAAALYDKAVEQYKQVIEKIPVIAEKLGVDLNAEPDTMALAANDTSKAAGELLKRAAEKDSTRNVAKKWYAKAKDKVSELLYTEASLTTENVDKAIALKSPYKDPVKDLIFRKTILEKAVAPAIKSTIEAHVRNLQEADKMGLSNKYVEESKRQILLTANLLGSEYEVLSYGILDRYEKISRELQDLIAKPFGAKNAAGLDYYGLDESASQMLDYIKIISEKTINSYANTLNLAREYNIQNDLVRNTEDRLLRFSLEFSERLMADGDSAKALSTTYQAIFDSTENYNYDDGTGFFENYYFSLTDNAKDLLDQAFNIKEEYDIKGLWANKLLFKLIQLDPVTYSPSIEKEKIELYSDESWKYATVYYGEEWVKTDFDDSDWENAVIVPSSGNPFDSLGVNPQAIWERIAATVPQGANDTLQSDSLNADTLGAVVDTTSMQMASADTTGPEGEVLQATLVGDTLVFFRKVFDLPGTALGGAIYFTADDNFRIYLNGEYMMEDSVENMAKIDSLDFYTFNITLKQGKNVIAIDVGDKDRTAKGLKLYAYFELLPADIAAAAEEKAKVKKVYVDPEILRRVNILNRSRISLKQR